MPRLSPIALKARIDRLQKQLAAIETKKAPAIRKVQNLMKKLGVTISDLKASTAASKAGGMPKLKKGAPQKTGNSQKTRARRGKVAVKFRDDNGNTWTGRGKTPRWLVEAEKVGKNRDSFKI